MSMMNIIITFVARSFATAEDFISAIASAIATLNVGETLDIDLCPFFGGYGGCGPCSYSSFGHFTDAEAPQEAYEDCLLNGPNEWTDYFCDLFLTRMEDGTIDIWCYEE